jgi:DNA invertase Pin-like site-specific DNA recombinase
MTGWNFIGRSQQLSVPAPTGKEIGKKKIAPPVVTPGTPTAASLKVDLDRAGTRNRPEFQRMLDQIRAGDAIVVWKLDRLARSTRDLLETMETIQQAGGKFQSLSEPWADTTTHGGK